MLDFVEYNINFNYIFLNIYLIQFLFCPFLILSLLYQLLLTCVIMWYKIIIEILIKNITVYINVYILRRTILQFEIKILYVFTGIRADYLIICIIQNLGRKGNILK